MKIDVKSIVIGAILGAMGTYTCAAISLAKDLVKKKDDEEVDAK